MEEEVEEKVWDWYEDGILVGGLSGFVVGGVWVRGVGSEVEREA